MGQIKLIPADTDKLNLETLTMLSDFLNKDVEAVIDYIEENDVPPEYLIPNRKMDVHPTRDYLLRIPNTINMIQKIKKELKAEDEVDIWAELDQK